jgi:DNA-directed RNA polymerase alpha subunit
MTSGIESARRDMSDDDERIVTGIETTIAIAAEREIEIVTVIAHQHIALIVVFLPAAATRSEKSHPPLRTQLLRHLSMKSH